MRRLHGFARWLYTAPLPFANIVEAAALQDVLKRRVDKLSGGQGRRIRCALAIAGDPQLQVLDAPTLAMDGESRHAF